MPLTKDLRLRTVSARLDQIQPSAFFLVLHMMYEGSVTSVESGKAIGKIPGAIGTGLGLRKEEACGWTETEKIPMPEAVSEGVTRPRLRRNGGGTQERA